MDEFQLSRDILHLKLIDKFLPRFPARLQNKPFRFSNFFDIFSANSNLREIRNEKSFVYQAKKRVETFNKIFSFCFSSLRVHFQAFN